MTILMRSCIYDVIGSLRNSRSYIPFSSIYNQVQYASQLYIPFSTIFNSTIFSYKRLFSSLMTSWINHKHEEESHVGTRRFALIFSLFLLYIYIYINSSSIHPYLSIHLPIHPFIHPSIYLPIHLSTHPPIYFIICSFVHLSIHFLNIYIFFVCRTRLVLLQSTIP